MSTAPHPSLLITFFFQEMPELIENDHLFLAMPPLYKLTHGAKSVYARDDKHKAELVKSEFPANAKVEISRFKGLGEMNAPQLKETTMDPAKRILLRVEVAKGDKAAVTEAVPTNPSDGLKTKDAATLPMPSGVRATMNGGGAGNSPPVTVSEMSLPAAVAGSALVLGSVSVRTAGIPLRMGSGTDVTT